MADYIVTGKKGDGKSLVCVGKIRDALLDGRIVATNLNLNLDKLLPRNRRAVRCYRLPDFPSVHDMEALGLGCDTLDEDRFGLIVLDEMAVWMNSRDYRDPRRQPLLDWFVHSRKARWHSFFIAQGLNQLDKQFRESLADHHVACRRMDKVRIPFLGPLTKHLIGKEIRPPKMHVASVKYGIGTREAMLSDRWSYFGHGLYPAYDTEQKFSESYADGLYSYLSPWHTLGRHNYRPETLREFVRYWVDPPALPKPPPRPKHALVDLVMRLPVDQRIKHVRRLQLAGVL